MSGSPIQLDVFSDVACPWCYIGKRRLSRALAACDVPVAIRWRAFELRPDMPPEGVPARAMYEQKFGGAERMRAAFARVTEAAREDGLIIDHEKIERAPNSRLAHRVIQLAGPLGVQDAVVEAVFRGHFELGVNVSDRGALLEHVCAHTTIDREAMERALDDGAGLAEVLADEDAAAELGVAGVPFFIADGRLAVSGAQPPVIFQRFLAAARDHQRQMNA